MRRRQGFGPHRIGWALGVARSTVYAVLRRFGLNRLDRLHRVTRESVRYEHPAPGDLLHLDVKKLARIPDGGGHRAHGRSSETTRGRGAGLDYLHVAVDDHSRYAYVETLPDERGATCAAFLERALAHFRTRGVAVRRVLTDNARNYTVARVFLAVADANGLTLKLTRPYRPQTNGNGGALHPDPAERVGLRPPVPLQRRTSAPAPALALPLQRSPTARRHRRGCPRLAPVNNVRGIYS